MGNLAETVKKQTDRILRQRSLNQTEGVVVSGVSSGAGAPAPVVNSPAADLTAHKASEDHDGRYYTESEIDGMLNFLGLSDTPAAYTGEGGKIVAVKADVSGLEFVAAPAAANGIPTGGTAGQVLEKIDGTDYNTQWVDVNAVKIKSKPVNILDFTGKDGYILAYDETAGEFYLKADDGGGSGGGYTFGWNYEDWANQVTVTDFYKSSVVDESQTFVGGAITLTHAPGYILPGQVVTSSDGLTTYAETTDYTVNRQTGVITGVTIADATVVLIDYSYISKV